MFFKLFHFTKKSGKRFHLFIAGDKLRIINKVEVIRNEATICIFNVPDNIWSNVPELCISEWHKKIKLMETPLN